MWHIWKEIMKVLHKGEQEIITPARYDIKKWTAAFIIVDQQKHYLKTLKRCYEFFQQAALTQFKTLFSLFKF